MLQPKKKFKALIIDCDGTLVSNKIDGLPSIGVTEAIEKVSKIIHVGIATSRPKFLSVPIMKHLKLSGPSIISGGSQIIDGKTFKILKEQKIDRKDLLSAIAVFKKYKINYLVEDGSRNDKQMKYNLVPESAIQMAAPGLEPELADKLKDELSEGTNLAVLRTFSWQVGKADIVITHASSTKQHGILEVARLLKIDTHEIIGVGDGYNDFPLLMACGLKVAMGNAVDDLKAIADYVAPTVEEDGVVDVINRFIL